MCRCDSEGKPKKAGGKRKNLISVRLLISVNFINKFTHQTARKPA